MRKAALSALILTALLLSPARSASPTSAVPDPLFQVAFLDVGQGDAILIQDGAGFDVLVDGGKPSAGPLVLETLREAGVDDLEVLIASHSDQDHIGGLVDVLAAPDLPIESVLYNGYPGLTELWSEFTAAVAAEGLSLIPTQSPQAFSWGRMNVQVLNPPPGQPNLDQNNLSLVLLIDFGEVEVLLSGDIEAQAEEELSGSGFLLAAEVLKVPHHGSGSSSTAGFLAAVQPEIAVISTGPNAYGHPEQETMQRLGAVGAEVYRTDFLGSIVFTSDGSTYSLSPIPVFFPLVSVERSK